MAFDNIEIEIKLPLEDVDLPKVKKFIEENCVLIKQQENTDIYFSPKTDSYLDCEYPYKWFSVRTRGDKYTLNYKHFYPENAPVNGHCDELELAISDPITMTKMLEALGFEIIVTVKKNRHTYNYQEMFEVVLDQVDELGNFIEIEALKDLGGVEKTRGELERLIQYIGLDLINVDYLGYPHLLMIKQGKMKVSKAA